MSPPDLQPRAIQPDPSRILRAAAHAFAAGVLSWGEYQAAKERLRAVLDSEAARRLQRLRVRARGRWVASAERVQRWLHRADGDGDPLVVPRW